MASTLKLLHPKDIIKQLKATYNRAEHLKSYIDAEAFSVTIKFKRLSQKEIEKNFIEIRNWIEELKQTSFEIEFQTIAYRSLGEQSIPKQLLIDRDEFLRLLSKQRVFREHIRLIEESFNRFPKLKSLLEDKPKLLMEYDEVWEQLLNVCDYLLSRPKPNLYMRELTIEGVDTKFMESHKKVLDLMLSTLLDTAVVKLAQNGFEKRYGLKYDLPTIRFRILDEELYICGLSDISLPLNEFKTLDFGCDRVFVTENKINGLSFPDMRGAMVIFGLGYGVESLGEVAWLQRKKLYYWGDIDTHGFAILSQVRGYFSHIESLLMDEETLEEHKQLAIKEPLSKRFLGELKYLTPREQRVFQNLKDDVYGREFRLEQERIPISCIKIAKIDR